MNKNKAFRSTYYSNVHAPLSKVHRNAPSYHSVWISTLNVPNTGNLIANWLGTFFAGYWPTGSQRRGQEFGSCSTFLSLNAASPVSRWLLHFSLYTQTTTKNCNKIYKGDKKIVLHTLNSEYLYPAKTKEYWILLQFSTYVFIPVETEIFLVNFLSMFYISNK